MVVDAGDQLALAPAGQEDPTYNRKVAAEELQAVAFRPGALPAVST